MTFDERIERDSVSPEGVRATTVVWTIPRVVLAECHTHRTLSDGAEYTITERMFPPGFSKNTSSSRAVPVPKMWDVVETTPYVPVFGLYKKGMQAGDRLEGSMLKLATGDWLKARDACVEAAKRLYHYEVHKQDANRPLEPFGWVTQVLTADQYNWANFFKLRCHEGAHPAIRKAARRLYLKYRASTPLPLKVWQWHLPFTDHDVVLTWRWDDFNGTAKDLPEPIRQSAARCAWVSYNSHDGDGGQEKIDRTIGVLMDSDPLHASPAEHQLSPMVDTFASSSRNLRSNISGYAQLRKLLPREAALSYEASEEEIAAWRAEGDVE